MRISLAFLSLIVVAGLFGSRTTASAMPVSLVEKSQQQQHQQRSNDALSSSSSSLRHSPRRGRRFLEDASEDGFIQGSHDFKWRLEPSDRFVDVLHDTTTDEQILLFHYETSNSSAEYKQFHVTIFEEDCETISNVSALVASFDDRQSTNLTVGVMIDQGHIGQSDYFTSSSSNSSGTVKFCLMVSFLYVDPASSTNTNHTSSSSPDDGNQTSSSDDDGNHTPHQGILMNFLHTEVTIQVGLLSTFKIESVNAKIKKKQVWTEVEYNFELVATMCDPSLEGHVFSQGSVVELCVFAPGNASYSVEAINALKIFNSGAEVSLIKDRVDGIYAKSHCGGDNFFQQCRIIIHIPSLFFDIRETEGTVLSLEGSATISLSDFASSGGVNATRRLTWYDDDFPEDYDQTATLPEDSTGFKAQIYITYPDDEDGNDDQKDSSSSSGYVMNALVALAWTMISMLAASLLL